MPSTIVIATRDELRLHIHRAIAMDGPRCDLNHLDVSGVESFSMVFRNTHFNGDISGWNTRSMRSAMGMFFDCPFHGDISKWNTSSLRNATSMFAFSHFNGDISKWNVAKVKIMARMFESSWFCGDLSQWCVHEKLIDTRNMFKRAQFSGDLSPWTLRQDCNAMEMVDQKFTGCLPRPQNGKESMYHQMMGSFFYFAHYLKKSGLNATCIACMMDYETPPVWAKEEHHTWVQSQKKLGQDLGLAGKELLQMMITNAKLNASTDNVTSQPNPGIFA